MEFNYIVYCVFLAAEAILLSHVRVFCERCESSSSNCLVCGSVHSEEPAVVVPSGHFHAPGLGTVLQSECVHV